MAGILAGSYPMINLFARPTGGCFSYNFGREVTLTIVTTGIAGSFLLLGQVTTAWIWMAAPNCRRRNDTNSPIVRIGQKITRRYHPDLKPESINQSMQNRIFNQSPVQIFQWAEKTRQGAA